MRIKIFKYFNNVSRKKLLLEIKNDICHAYGREIAWYSNVDYINSVFHHKRQKMPRYISTIAREVEKACNLENGFLDSVLINIYHKETQTTEFHKDNSIIFHKEIIVNLSLFTDAILNIRDENLNTISFNVKPNDIFILPGGSFQELFEHEVISQKNRVSLSFRNTNGGK